MVIPCILLAFFQALSVAVIAAAAAAIPDQSSLGFEGSFSLSVAATSHQSRGFLRDWAAARQKWGKGIPKDVATAFSLLDSSEWPILPPKTLERERGRTFKDCG
jgi:hypothetical protein